MQESFGKKTSGICNKINTERNILDEVYEKANNSNFTGGCSYD